MKTYPLNAATVLIKCEKTSRNFLSFPKEPKNSKENLNSSESVPIAHLLPLPLTPKTLKASPDKSSTSTPLVRLRVISQTSSQIHLNYVKNLDKAATLVSTDAFTKQLKRYTQSRR